MNANVAKGIFQAPLGRGARLRALAVHVLALAGIWSTQWIAFEAGAFNDVHPIVVLGLVYFIPLTYLYWIADRGIQIVLGPSLLRAVVRIVLALGLGVGLHVWPVLAVAAIQGARGWRVHRQPIVPGSGPGTGEYYPGSSYSLPAGRHWAPNAFGGDVSHD